MEIKCKKCGILFNNKHKNQKYCSRKCFSDDKQDNIEQKICIFCGKIYKNSNYTPNRKYCSQQCYWKDKKIYNNNCLICGKETIHKFCSKKCYGLSIIKDKIDKKCIYCGNIYNSTNKKSQYCSKLCYWNFRRNNPNVQIQSNNVKNLTSRNCLNCNHEYFIEKYRLNISHYCSKKCQYEHHTITKICPTCNKEFKVSKYLERRIYCSKSCNLITNDSKYEREIKNFLLNFINIKKIKVKLDGKTICPDICFNNKIIECFGDYWHCNPLIYSEDYYHKRIKKYARDVWLKDEIRLNILKNKGYDILIIWEKDYNSNKEETLQKIKNFYEIC